MTHSWYFFSPGKVKSIGVSNFSIKNLEILLPKVNVVPVVNQVELHPYLPQFEMKKYCEVKDILLTAYSPLGRFWYSRTQFILVLSLKWLILNLLQCRNRTNKLDNMALPKDETIVEVAERTGSSVGQVLLNWGVQRGTVVIPKSEKEEIIKQNTSVSSCWAHRRKGG